MNSEQLIELYVDKMIKLSREGKYDISNFTMKDLRVAAIEVIKSEGIKIKANEDIFETPATPKLDKDTTANLADPDGLTSVATTVPTDDGKDSPVDIQSGLNDLANSNDVAKSRQLREKANQDRIRHYKSLRAEQDTRTVKKDFGALAVDELDDNLDDILFSRSLKEVSDVVDQAFEGQEDVTNPDGSLMTLDNAPADMTPNSDTAISNVGEPADGQADHTTLDVLPNDPNNPATLELSKGVLPGMEELIKNSPIDPVADLVLDKMYSQLISTSEELAIKNATSESQVVTKSQPTQKIDNNKLKNIKTNHSKAPVVKSKGYSMAELMQSNLK